MASWAAGRVRPGRWTRRSLLANAVVEGFGCTLPASTALTPAALQPNHPHRTMRPRLQHINQRLVHWLVALDGRGDESASRANLNIA